MSALLKEVKQVSLQVSTYAVLQVPGDLDRVSGFACDLLNLFIVNLVFSSMQKDSRLN